MGDWKWEVGEILGVGYLEATLPVAKVTMVVAVTTVATAGEDGLLVTLLPLCFLQVQHCR